MRAQLAIAFACACSPEPGPPHPPPDDNPLVTPGITAQTTPPEQPTNVLMVILDDVGVDKVSSYGVFPEQPVTPTLDGLASEGMRFQWAYSAPTCSPARAWTYTGRFGRRTGIGRWILPTDDTWSLPATEVTLPVVLAGAPVPWTSALVGKWHLVSYDYPVPTEHPIDSGYTDFTGSLANLGSPFDQGLGRSYTRWEKVVDGVGTESDTYATTDEADEAIARLQTLPQPFCLTLSFNAPHVPLHVPQAGLFTVALSDPPTDVEEYDAMLEAADTELGRVLASMSADLRARTTIIVFGDNGTWQDVITPPFDRSRGKGSLFDGGVRIPLIVAGPFVGVPGSVSDALVEEVDLLPTIAEIAGAPLPDVPIDGVSFLPQLRDPTAPGARQYAWSDDFFPNGAPPYAPDSSMVRNAAYKLVRAYGSGAEALYHYTGGIDEGPDLLALGPLDDDAQAALFELEDVADAMRASLAYEP
jgi:arylsulfatase A-like enzyme